MVDVWEFTLGVRDERGQVEVPEHEERARRLNPNYDPRDIQEARMEVPYDAVRAFDEAFLQLILQAPDEVPP